MRGSRCPWEHKNGPKVVTVNPKIWITGEKQNSKICIIWAFIER